jgi:hypothetical protein
VFKMKQASSAKLSLIPPAPTATADTPPAKPASTRTAVKRCLAAWQRAYDASMAKADGNFTNTVFAELDAEAAYRRAMPLLSSFDSIRDFIACAAHGILIGALREKTANQSLYAAQIALSSLHYQPKPPKSVAA